MTPKDKAKELIDKFSIVGLQQQNEGIECALICVDEIIKANPYSEAQKYIPAYSTIKYWQEVREEILKL